MNKMFMVQILFAQTRRAFSDIEMQKVFLNIIVEVNGSVCTIWTSSSGDLVSIINLVRLNKTLTYYTDNNIMKI